MTRNKSRGKRTHKSGAQNNTNSIATVGLPAILKTELNKAMDLNCKDERLPKDGRTFTALTPIPRCSPPLPMVYCISQEYSVKDYVSTSSTVPTHVAPGWTLAGVDQYTALTAVFDQYMCPELEIWLIPNQSQASSLSLDGLSYSVLDFDDNTPLTSVAQYGDYSNCVTGTVASGHYRHFTPHIAMNVYGSGFGAYGNQRLQWLDAASPNVNHYGVKFGVTASSSTVTFDLIVRARILFKSTR
jgi:hypothetical protein